MNQGGGGPMEVTNEEGATLTTLEVLKATQEPNQQESRIGVGPAVLDITVIVAVAVAFVVVPMMLWKPPKLGFFCNDHTIRYPYREALVGVTAAGIVLIIAVVVPILGVEVFRIMRRNGMDLQAFTIRPCDFIILLKRMSRYIGSLLIGLLMNVALSRMAKYVGGRLKPNFLDACKPAGPDWDTCSALPNRAFFVVDYYCTGDQKLEDDIRTSFYSNRISLMTHTAIFAVLYMQERLPSKLYCYLLRPTIQVLFVILALFIGYSHVRDRHQYVSDVLAAYAAGLLTAVYSAVFIARMFIGEKKVSLNLDEKSGAAAPCAAFANDPLKSQGFGAAGVESSAPQKYAPYTMSTGTTDQHSMLRTDQDSVLKSGKSGTQPVQAV